MSLVSIGLKEMFSQQNKIDIREGVYVEAESNILEFH